MFVYLLIIPEDNQPPAHQPPFVSGDVGTGVVAGICKPITWSFSPQDGILQERENLKARVVAVPASAPPVAVMTANPPVIPPGGSSYLAWNCGPVGTTSTISIDHGIGAVGLSGVYLTSPTVTTTYTVSIATTGGSASASAAVVVDNPLVPEDTTFTVDLNHSLTFDARLYVSDADGTQTVTVASVGAKKP